MFAIYVLHSQSLDRYYVGYTNDLERRLTEHNRKKGKYTDSGIPWELVYHETYSTKTAAMSPVLIFYCNSGKKFMNDILKSK